MDGAGISEMYIRLAWRNLLALRKEGGHNNRTRSTQLFAAEVGFGHDGLHGDSFLVAEGDGLQRPNGRGNISKGETGDILDIFALTCTLGWQQREL